MTLARAPFLVLVLVLVLGSGCGYLEARGRDFSQIIRLEAGGGLAFSVDTRLGGLLDFGLGGGYTWDAGLLYGEPYAGTELRVVAPGFCRRAIGPTEIWSHQCPSLLPPVFAAESYTLPKLTHLGTHLHEYDVEVGVAAGIVHVHFGFSPGELLDFILGLATIDIAGDDRGAKPAPAPKPAPPVPARPAAAPATTTAKTPARTGAPSAASAPAPEPNPPPASGTASADGTSAPPEADPNSSPKTAPQAEPPEPRAPPRRHR